jgi:hypothetical protein
VDEVRIPSGGDPFIAAGTRSDAGSTPASRGSTRHHRCDHEFVQLLEEDFGVAYFALSLAFLGMPAEPKKAAIAVTEWAAKQDDPAKALLAWARKNGRCAFAITEDLDEDSGRS